MEWAVTLGRQRKTRTVVCRIGIDENAAAKGHHALPLVGDLNDGTVKHSVEDPKQKRLSSYDVGMRPAELIENHVARRCSTLYEGLPLQRHIGFDLFAWIWADRIQILLFVGGRQLWI